MASVDSLTFGQPNGLLSGLPTFEAATSSTGPQDAFLLNGLLPGSPPAEFMDVQSSILQPKPQMGLTADVLEESTQSGGSAFQDPFVHTGLLSAGLSPAHGPDEDSTQRTKSFCESQDIDFPEVSELLRPYTMPAPSAGCSSSSNALPLRASSFDGKAIFLKRKARRMENAPSQVSTDGAPLASGSGSRFSKLLDVPVHRLLDQLSSETAAKLSCSDGDSAMTVSPQPTSDTDTSLWVDRYRPRRFTDLLGDDRVHREVMAWVKEWDYCVFGRREARGRKRARGEDDENLDEWRRPREKLLLLSGPPGMGKTTLAHVAAQHAGYSVFEINASDARSAQVVEDRLRPALEAGSRVGSNKPILAVIDEIDGAIGGTDNSGGFIQKLIQLTYDKPRKKGRKADPKAARPLLRPIICICNDLYASSLTKLRAHARIVRFSRPNNIHLVRRLREICENEGIPAESRALTALVGIAQGDLRGCLNTLQLIKARGREVTEPVIRSATAGMKEGDTSLSSVMNDLFSPMTRKRAKDLGISEEEETRYVGRLSREIESSGAMDKVAQGCFEHYANLHRHDANFSRYLKANEWLTAYDTMSGEMRSEREYALMQYLPYLLVGFYPLFQERGGTRLERAKVDYENYLVTKTNSEIYESLARCLRSAARNSGDYRHLASSQILQLELAPLLNRIISPPLNPVNRQIIRPGEKAILSRLVDIMVALELRFVQEKMEDGQLVYRLDPPIDVFVTYDGKRASDIPVSKYAVRHLVAAEIDARLVSLQTEVGDKNKANKADFFRKTPKAGKDADNDDGAVDPSITKRPRIEQTESAEKIAVDFFGRPITAPTRNAPKMLVGKKSAHQYRVAYRFREGNSAAVRKPVKVGSFL